MAQYKRSCGIFRAAGGFCLVVHLQLVITTHGHLHQGLSNSELLADFSVTEGVALLQTRAGMFKRQTHVGSLARAGFAVSFTREKGQMCGACGDGNDLHIGIGGRRFDEVKKGEALDVCGPVCERHGECGGFSFVETLQRCYYRRVTTCQQLEDAAHDCYTKLGDDEGQGKVFLLAAKSNYIFDRGRMCGACGTENNLALGVEGKHFDGADRETAIEICGLKCNQHKDCGGFNFVESLGNCYYRKLTSCQASQDADRDCYTKTIEDPDQDGSADELQTGLFIKTKNLEKTLRERRMALKQKELDLSQLQTVIKAMGQIGSTEAVEGVAGNTGVGGIHDDPMSILREAVLDEDSYQAVLALSNVTETEQFVRRVIAELHCQVIDEGGLAGFVPFFSGQSAQSFSDLQAQILAVSLQQDSWISPLRETGVKADAPTALFTTGVTAFLNQDGYSAVAALEDISEMKKFVRRVVVDLGCNVTNEGGFEGLVQYYYKASAQTYDGLKSELLSESALHGGWLDTIEKEDAHDDHESLLDAVDGGMLDERPVDDYAPAVSDIEVADEHVEEQLSQQDSLSKSGQSYDDEPHEAMEEAEAGQKVSVDESELDYEFSIDQSESGKQIAGFQFPSMLHHAADEEVGEEGNSSADLAISGGSASLDEDGYAAVVALWNDSEMERFVQRTASECGYNVTSKGGLEGFAPFYSKENAQSFARLKAELLVVSKLTRTWLSANIEATNISPLTRNSTAQKQTKSIPTLEDESMMESESETDSHYHAGDLLAVTADAAKMLWQIPTIWDPRSTLKKFNSYTLRGGPSGETAALSQKGYKEVVALNNGTEMVFFVQRMVNDLDYDVTNKDGLRDFIPLYGNGTEQNYSSLIAGIVSASSVDNSWVTQRDHGPSKAQMFMGAFRQLALKTTEQLSSAGTAESAK